MTKFDWEAFAKKTKAQEALEKNFLEGPPSISGVSEWEKRMEGRCPICNTKVQNEEGLALHIYYSHSREYKEQRKKIRTQIEKQGRWEAMDGSNLNAIQRALLEAVKSSRAKKNE